MHWRGNDLVGTVLILDTLPGLALRKLYTSGMLAGVSSRGLATLEQEDENGAAIIGNDYEIIAFDYVSDPSTPDAFLEPPPLAMQCALSLGGGRPDPTKNADGGRVEQMSTSTHS